MKGRARLVGLLLACAHCAGTVRAETMVLSGATVHTVHGQPLTAAQVLIQDGRIAAVGQGPAVNADRVVNLNGLHLYPGLIESASSLGLVEIESVRATRDTAEVGGFAPEVKAWQAVNPDSDLIPVARANGVTHVLVAPSGGPVAGQSGLIALDGWTTEQMVRRAPVGLHLVWPGTELDPRAKGEFADPTKWKSLVDQAKDRRLRVKALDDFFADAEAYAQTVAGATDPMRRREIEVPAWEEMLPFVQRERPLFIQADEIRQIQAALEWTAKREALWVLVGGRDAWMAASKLAERRVPVIYDSVFTLPPRDTASYDVQFRAPAILHRAGVKVILAHGGRHEASSLRNVPYSAAQAVAHGLPPLEALRALTLYPAQVLGVSDRLGTIEIGREATLFAVDGDILDIRSNVKRMWIAGREINLETRHTRLYDRYRQRPRATER